MVAALVLVTTILAPAIELAMMIYMLLPLRLVKEKIGEFSQQYPKGKTLVTYCGGIGCPIAHVLAETLREDYGYTDVREMPGGYTEWRLAEKR